MSPTGFPRLLALCLLFMTPCVLAAKVAGVDIPDNVRIDGQPLVLNGAGIRTKFFFRIYVGALYLPRRSRSVEKILTMPGPKRVLMHFLYSEVGRDKLVDAWNEGFERNVSKTRREAMNDRIHAFEDLFDTVRQGDEILLDYVPEDGTRVTVNGKHRGTVPGDDLARAWLRIFIGRHPADGDLKEGMLGG